MNKKIIIVSIAGMAIVSVLALLPLPVDAVTNQIHGGLYGANGLGNGQTTKAQALNMTADQLKEQLQTKTLAEVIASQEMTLEQYKNGVKLASQERWREMGLSDEEIQTRAEAQEERQADCGGTGSVQNQGGLRFGQNNR